MKRERMLPVAVGLLGILYLWPIYPLYTDLWHSKWLLEMNNACDPMFLSWFIALGPFLLLAARKPSSHRSLITFAACQCFVHASVIAVQELASVERKRPTTAGNAVKGAPRWPRTLCARCLAIQRERSAKRRN